MTKWLSRIKKNGDDHVEVLLLGNKIDLINDRTVSEDESVAFAKEQGILHYETSAKDSINVDRAFKQLIGNILQNENLQEKITL